MKGQCVRGVRGAVTVPANEENAILECTARMISQAIESNRIQMEDIATIIFAVTPDLNGAFPAKAARRLGLQRVPLLDFVSPGVVSDLPRTVRMLLLWNTTIAQDQVRHVYLGEAVRLRPDLANSGMAGRAMGEGGSAH